MNKAQRKKKRQEIRRLQEQRRLEKAKALEEQIDDEDVLDEAVIDESVDDIPDEEVKKDYMEASMPSPQPGPTSFEELDAMRLASEQAEATQEVIWDAEMLVRNILTSQMLDPDEKVSAMNEVADEFASRVATEKEDIEKDLELLQLEVMVAQDKHSTPFSEYYLDISKAVLSSARRNALSDSDFALVTTRNGKKIRKYPIHDKAHVRNALARAAQMMKRGGQGAADARAAMSKIRSAAKRMGIGSDMKKDRNAIIIEKGSDEKWRWIGWGSNNFLDRDGEIISEKAHQEYVDWWEKNKNLSPVFDTWHIPGTARKNPVDTIFYEKGFLIMSGELTEEEAAGLLRVQKETDLGMSIGAIGLGRDPKDPKVITKYRAYAITDLPLDNAANPFTGFETIVKEVGMDKKAYLTKIFGDEAKAEAFLETTDLKQKQLQDAGIASKEEKPPVEEPEKVEKVEAGKEQAPVQSTPTLAIDEVVKQVMKEMDIPGLNAFVNEAKEAMEKVPILEDVIKKLQGSKDEDLAKALTPPASRFAWSQENRITEKTGNVVEPGDPILEKVPGVPDGYWLSNATKTTPIKETAQ